MAMKPPSVRLQGRDGQPFVGPERPFVGAARVHRPLPGLVDAAGTLVDSSLDGGNQAGSSPSRAIFSCQIGGASVWTFLPSLSTATVTGMSSTVNS